MTRAKLTLKGAVYLAFEFEEVIAACSSARLTRHEAAAGIVQALDLALRQVDGVLETWEEPEEDKGGGDT